jgi:hypothetical protein
MHETRPAGDEERRVFQQMLGLHGGPAFVRRQKGIEEAERRLHETLQRKRDENLTMVRLRVGQLRALAGDWESLRPMVATGAALDRLRHLHDTLRPELRVPLQPTGSRRTLRRALAALMEAINAFDRRWQGVLAKVDLTPLNALREAYNKYYLLEKECAVGNPRIARIGYQRLEPLTVADLLRQFPLLAPDLTV